MCQLRDGGEIGDKAYSGGGSLIELGVHVIDLIRYMAGCPKPVSAYGVTFNNLGCHCAAANESAKTGKSVDITSIV